MADQVTVPVNRNETKYRLPQELFDETLLLAKGVLKARDCNLVGSKPPEIVETISTGDLDVLTLKYTYTSNKDNDSGYLSIKVSPKLVEKDGTIKDFFLRGTKFESNQSSNTLPKAK